MQLKQSALSCVILCFASLASANAPNKPTINQQMLEQSLSPQRSEYDTSRLAHNKLKRAPAQTPDVFQQLVMSGNENTPRVSKRDLRTSKAFKQPTQNTGLNSSYQGTYFLNRAGDEITNLNVGRLQLNENDGTIWLTQGAATFDLSIDSEGFLILELHEPLLMANSFMYIDGNMVQRQNFLNKLEMRPTTLEDGYVEFSTDLQYSDVYPNNEFPTETYWGTTEYQGINASKQLNVASLLQLNTDLHIPLDRRHDTVINYNDGLSHPAYTQTRSMRVHLTSKNLTNADGTWQFMIANASGQLLQQAEQVSVTFNDDGSATFIGQSGLTATVNAYPRRSDNTTLLNVVYYQDSSAFAEQKVAVDSHLAKKNPQYTHQPAGIYSFKQNGDDGLFWIEIYANGEAITVQPRGTPVDGKYPDYQIIPYLWGYLPSSEGTVIDLRRYYYRVNSGKSGWCTPDSFEPSPQSDCVLYNSRVINFYDTATINGQSAVVTEHQHRFYDTWSRADNYNQDVLAYIQTDNRYFYMLEDRPVPLPMPPVNDDFAAALNLADQNASFTGTTAEASAEPNELCHSDYYCNYPSVWYRYTASESGNLELSVKAVNAPVTPNLVVYTGSVLDNLTQLSVANYNSDTVNWKHFLSAGETVHIAVLQQQDYTGEFEFVWQFIPQPQTLITDIIMPDLQLRQCIDSTGAIYSQQLTSLNCSGVTNAEGLQHFTNLKFLTLSGQTWDPNNILVLEDVTPVAQLQNLVSLNLFNNRLTDAQLNALASLQMNSSNESPALMLNHNNLTEASISTIVQILEPHQYSLLSVAGNQFKHLNGLEQLQGLNALYLGNNPLADIPATINSLYDMPLLYTLDISNLNLTDLIGINLPPTLYALDLAGNPISDVAAVLAKTNPDTLHYLNLNYTAVSDGSPLENTNLFYLYLDHTNITDVNFAAKMPQLVQISLQSSFVDSIKPLLQTPNLGRISLWGNPQLRCSEITSFQSSRPEVYLDGTSDFCRQDSGYRFNLSTFEGYDVTGVTFASWDGTDYSQYGELIWQDGVLTFKAKPGFSGPLVLNINIQTTAGNMITTLKLYITAAKKRRGLPKWLFVFGDN